MNLKYKIPRIWLGALLLGALLSTLYAVDFAQALRLIFSHERVVAQIVHRQEDAGFFEVGYRFQEAGAEVYRERRYRFPETLFLKGMGEGEAVQLIRGPAGEMPVPLVRFEIFSSLGLFLLSLGLLLRSLQEIRRSRGQRARKTVSR